MNNKGYIYRSPIDQKRMGMNIPKGWYIITNAQRMPVTFWYTLDECRRFVRGIDEEMHELGMDDEIEVEWIVQD